MAGVEQFGLERGDFAPGDRAAADREWSGVELIEIDAPGHPWRESAYAWLWEEFGGRGEMELEAVIDARLARDPGEAVQGCRLLYRMWALRVGDELAAVRDATAIVRPEGTVVVHLSHVVVAPAHRRTGVAALLRAVPVRLAREAWTRAGRAGRPNEVVLVAEMEPWDAAVPDRVTRLRAYATAGFSVIEPVALRYRQPDFRSPAEIDAGGGACLLPMWLLVRRVGREEETVMPREEVRAAVGALYAMYGAEFRRRDMALVWADWRGLDRADSRFALHSPIAIRTP